MSSVRRVTATTRPAHQIEKAVRVAPLVVVPPDHLHEIPDGHGRERVERARRRTPDDVARDDRVLGVDQATPKPIRIRRRAERRVDLLDGRLAVQDGDQIRDRSVGHGHAHRHAIHLALQLGEGERRGLRRAGRGGYDVHGRRSPSAQILVREVQQVLVVRVRVHRRHERPIDAEAVLQHLGHRRDAVRGARGVRDDVMRCRVVRVVVHAHDDRHVLALRRRADDHLLRASFQMRRGLLPVREQAGGLDDDLGPELLPRQIGGVTLGHDADLDAVNRDAVVGRADVGV